MAKVTIPTDEKKFKKFVKACAKEMQLIVNPTVKGTKEPIEVAKGSVEKIQKKIIACAKVLTAQDELSNELTALLEDLDVEIPSDDDSPAASMADFPSKEEVSKMKSPELKELNKSKNLKVKTSGVKVKDLRDLIWEAIADQTGGAGGADLPDEDAIDDMDFDDMEDLVISTPALSDEIDMDDFDEDDDDEDALRSAILKVIAGLDKKPGKEKDTGDVAAIDFPEVDEDDPDEAHGLLVVMVKEHDLDIDPEDFDEDDEDEVNDFLDQVKKAIKAKASAAEKDDEKDEATIPKLPDADDIDDDAEEVHSALTVIVKALGLEIDPEDFDEDDEDEVTDFHKKVAKGLKKFAKKAGKGKGKDKEPETPVIITAIEENSDDFKALKKLAKGDGIFEKLVDKLKAFKKDPQKLAKKMLKIAQKNAAGSTKKEKSGKKIKDTSDGKVNQTQLIRDMLSAGAKRKKIVAAIETKCGKTAGQAESRMKSYEKTYGDMGADDPKLK